MKKKNLLIAVVCFLLAGLLAYQIGWAIPPSPPANTSVGAITSGTVTGATITNSPISGSTGSFTTLTVSGKVDWAKGADIASATTTDIGAATGTIIDITGTTTIASFGTTTAGVTRLIRFTGALTLTYNATSMILPGARDIVTEAGDRATFVSLGSGNWYCHAFMKANGRVLGDVIIATDSGTANVTTDKMRGQTHIVTGNYVESLPTAAVGYSATFYASTAAVFSIDVVTGSDVIILNGTSLTAGYKATSDGTINAEIYCECRVAGFYNCKSILGVFADGGS